jgi:dinuclear metal center YbgI/SA1388 family protein
MKISEVIDYINTIAPPDTAEEWDNSGLCVGDKNAEVTGILFALDVTSEVINEAVKLGANLIVTHHPAIFVATKTVLSGDVIYESARNNLTLFSAHTPWDKAKDGTADTLIDILDLIPVESDETSLVRIAKTEPTTAESFAKKLAKELDAAVTVNLPNKKIGTIGIVTGGGSEFWEQAKDMGVDCLLTGEAKHHEFLICSESDFALIAAGHYHTEMPSMFVLKRKLSEKFGDIPCYMTKTTAPTMTYNSMKN